MKKHLIPLAFILFFGLFGMKALFSEGLFSAHDIWHQVARLYWYKESINTGIFAPNWISQLANGFGYPLFIFSYHLPWLLGLPFLNLGMSIENTIKVLFVLSFLGSGIGMYALAHLVTKNKTASLVTAVIYMWAPYHFLVILVSAAMGKAFVFTFTPLVAIGAYLLSKQQSEKKGIMALALSIVALVLTHLMSIVSMFPLIFIFLALRPKLKALVHSSLLGLGISAFYLLPAVVYSSKTQINMSGISGLYSDNFINLSQLIYSKWGYGIINHSAKEGSLSFQLGFAQWVGIVSAVSILIFTLFKKTKLLHTRLIIGVALATIASIFMMLDYSKPIWDLAARFVTLDYPFMFLTTAVFSASLLLGLVLTQFKGWKLYILFAGVLLLAFINNRNHLRVNLYTDIPLQTYIESEVTTNSFAEYLPKNADRKLMETPQKQLTFPDKLTVSNVNYTPNKLSFDVSSDKSREVSFRQFSFPGIVLLIDNKKVEHQINPQGLVTATVEEGQKHIEILFIKTKLQTISQIISILSLIVLAYYFKRFNSLNK